MTAVRFSSIVSNTIVRLWLYCDFSRIKPYLNEKKKYDKKDIIIKSKIDSVIQVLFAVIFNVDEYNRGKKNDLLNFIANIRNNDSRLKSSFLQTLSFDLSDILEDIEKNLTDNAGMDFILPPENLSSIHLATKIYKVLKEYGQISIWWRSQDEHEIIEHITLNILKILLFPENFREKLKQLEILEKDVLKHPDGHKFLSLLQIFLAPHKMIAHTFGKSGSGASARDLTTIVIDYYDETPDIKDDDLEKRSKMINKMFFSHSLAEKKENVSKNTIFVLDRNTR